MNYIQKPIYEIRKSSERGFFDHGWLKTYHTFSFGDYYDPKFMGFRDLRVINEDLVAPSKGFDTHPHKNMEIITVIVAGELAHKDSMGTSSVIKTHEVQAMSAGSGVRHSEFNPSSTNFVHLLQIWIVPDTENVKPEYRQTKLSEAPNTWQLIVSKKGENGSLSIHQDAKLYYLALEKGKKTEKILPPNRYGWLQIIEGELSFCDTILKAGDGVAIQPDATLHFEAKSPTQLLFFDLK